MSEPWSEAKVDLDAIERRSQLYHQKKEQGWAEHYLPLASWDVIDLLTTEIHRLRAALDASGLREAQEAQEVRNGVVVSAVKARLAAEAERDALKQRERELVAALTGGYALLRQHGYRDRKIEAALADKEPT